MYSIFAALNISSCWNPETFRQQKKRCWERREHFQRDIFWHFTQIIFRDESVGHCSLHNFHDCRYLNFSRFLLCVVALWFFIWSFSFLSLLSLSLLSLFSLSSLLFSSPLFLLILLRRLFSTVWRLSWRLWALRCDGMWSYLVRFRLRSENCKHKTR